MYLYVSYIQQTKIHIIIIYVCVRRMYLCIHINTLLFAVYKCKWDIKLESKSERKDKREKALLRGWWMVLFENIYFVLNMYIAYTRTCYHEKVSIFNIATSMYISGTVLLLLLLLLFWYGKKFPQCYRSHKAHFNYQHKL